MKTATVLRYFSIPAPNHQDGSIQVAPGEQVTIGSEFYPAPKPAFPSGKCVVVIKGEGIGLVDVSKFKNT